MDGKTILKRKETVTKYRVGGTPKGKRNGWHGASTECLEGVDLTASAAGIH